eukprot:6713651-Pyramimonas_sp.AAC.1
MQIKGTTEPLLKSKCSLLKPDPVSCERRGLDKTVWHSCSARGTRVGGGRGGGSEKEKAFSPDGGTSRNPSRLLR